MVHGTWSNRKIWESPFARELAKLLHVTTGIQPFELERGGTLSRLVKMPQPTSSPL